MPTARGRKRRGKNNATLQLMLTIREASQILGVHSSTLRRWSNQGIITAYRIRPHGELRFRPEDVAALIVEYESPKRVTRGGENEGS